MSASQDEHASLPSRAQAGKRHSGDAHKTMGIWVESHDQHESNAEISGTIGAWEDVQFASLLPFEIGRGHLFRFRYH